MNVIVQMSKQTLIKIWVQISNDPHLHPPTEHHLHQQQHTQQKMHSNNDQFLLGVFTHYVEYMCFHL